MKSYQERVVIERNELNTKIEALEVFIDSDNFKTLVSNKEQELLRYQYRSMVEYWAILNKRIAIYE
jgi:hypothetical protein